MKKHVPRVLLSLLFSCLFLFSGSLNIKASAFSGQPGTLENSWILHNTDYSWDLYAYGYPSDFTIQSVPYTEEQKGTSTLYRFNAFSEINNISSIYWFSVYNKSARFDFEYLPLVYDYYFLVQFSSSSTELYTKPFTFFPDEVLVSFSDFGEDNSIVPDEFNSVSVLSDDFKVTLSDTMGFSVVGKFPEPVSGSIDSNSFFSPVGFEFRTSTPNLLLPPHFNFEGLIVAVPKNTDTSSVLAILQDIADNTDDIEDKLDDIKQSIKDSFNFPSEEQEHLDSFIDDGFERFESLDPSFDFAYGLSSVFTADYSGPINITLPGFAIPVQGVYYPVWSDITFDMRQLEVWFPDFIKGLRNIMLYVCAFLLFKYGMKILNKFWRH